MKLNKTLLLTGLLSLSLFTVSGCGSNSPATPATIPTGTVATVATIAASTATTGLWDMTTNGTNLFISEENNVPGAFGNIINMNANTGVFTRIPIAVANAKPDGVTIAPNGDLYVSDKKNGKIYKIPAPYNLGATALLIPAGTFSTYTAGVGGGIDGIATDGTSLFVCDIGATATTGKIIQINIANPTLITPLATGLLQPWDLCLNGTDLYVAETNRVSRVTTGGIPTLGIITLPAVQGGITTRLDSITTDGTNLYIADTNANRIIKAPIGGGAVTAIATGFSLPDGLAVLGTSLFVADNGNYQVKKIQL